MKKFIHCIYSIDLIVEIYAGEVQCCPKNELYQVIWKYCTENVKIYNDIYSVSAIKTCLYLMFVTEVVEY